MGASVCCLVRSIPENQETGGDGVLYFDGTIHDMAEKWRRIAEDDGLVKDYAAKGYERVTSHYDWVAVTRQYLNAYAEVLNCSTDR